MICRFLAVILAFALFGAVGCRTVSSEEERGPKFSDYPVTQMFGGIPAAPKIVRPEERAASSIIQEGVEKGRWVLGSDRKTQRPGPNFAGHYIVIEWGGGPDYWQAIIVDAVTGQIFQPPMAGTGGQHAGYFSIPMDPLDFKGVKFRLDSKLMVLPRACPDRASGCRAYYFVWQDDRWIPA